jgi:hypothetical protein
LFSKGILILAQVADWLPLRSILSESKVEIKRRLNACTQGSSFEHLAWHEMTDADASYVHSTKPTMGERTPSGLSYSELDQKANLIYT